LRIESPGLFLYLCRRCKELIASRQTTDWNQNLSVKLSPQRAKAMVTVLGIVTE
jgi:hypothetical protein